MAEFKLIHGKRSIKYDHFREYELTGCRATDTRLMGVVALKLTWRSRTDRRACLYQVMHLDYSEYGIDDYKEFLCTPGAEDYAENKDAMNEMWNDFIGVMGGEVLDIDHATMLRLIEDALPLADDDLPREYDSDENREFRAYAKLRLGYMKEALSAEGITSADCSSPDAIVSLSPVKLSAYETIHYFVMRIVDQDFAAAATLSSMSDAALRDIELSSPGIQTLVKCEITRSDKKRDPSGDRSSFPFRCRITTLARERYYHATFVIWLSGNHRSKNPVVTDLRTGSLLALSDYEAAMQVSRGEYLTVFDCKDSMLNGFDSRYIRPFAHSKPLMVPNGWLYTAYKPNNSHVDSPVYRLEDDVYGYALLTIAGELVLMSHDLRNISTLDDETIFSMYSPFINTKGRYRLDTPVFQTLCQSAGLMFDDLVEPEN